MFALTARIGNNNDKVRCAAIGNEGFRPIYNPAIAIFFGIGFDILKVRASARF